MFDINIRTELKDLNKRPVICEGVINGMPKDFPYYESRDEESIRLRKSLLLENVIVYDTESNATKTSHIWLVEDNFTNKEDFKTLYSQVKKARMSVSFKGVVTPYIKGYKYTYRPFGIRDFTIGNIKDVQTSVVTMRKTKVKNDVVDMTGVVVKMTGETIKDGQTISQTIVASSDKTTKNKEGMEKLKKIDGKISEIKKIDNLSVRVNRTYNLYQSIDSVSNVDEELINNANNKVFKLMEENYSILQKNLNVCYKEPSNTKVNNLLKALIQFERIEKDFGTNRNPCTKNDILKHQESVLLCKKKIEEQKQED